MPPVLAGFALLAALVIAAQWLLHRQQQRLLGEIRANWGKPSKRVPRMDAVAEYHRSIVLTDGPGTALDQRTWSDLHLDDVFRAIDRTESTLGQQALYHRMRQQNASDLAAFERLVERMSTDTPTRERVQMALTGLRDPDGYDLWWLAQRDALTRPRWHLLFAAWAVIVFAAVIAIPFWPSAILIPVAGAAINLLVRTRTAWRTHSMIGPFRQVSTLIAVAETVQRANLPDPVAATLAGGLPKLTRLAAIARWVGRDPSTSNDVVASFWEYMNLLFLLDVNVLALAVGELRACGDTFLEVVAAVGQVDAAISVASLRAGTGVWVRPRFQPSWRDAALDDLEHPLIAEAVPNSIAFGPPYGVLVTGSNMSGKSTFLRTVGVAAVMAQSINTCFATGYRAPVVTVRSCIGRGDDLVAGKSYYLVEVEEVLTRVAASTSAAPHLFLFDELFRGTNAVERIAAGAAVLREMVRDAGGGPRHVVLAATHDAELVELLGDAYTACHFGDAIGPEGLTFDHRLAAGPATTRNAITLLELNGAPPSVIAAALATAAELDQQRRTPKTPGP